MSTTARNVTKGCSEGIPTSVATLAALDDLKSDTFAVFCYADVRPLRGAAGVVDWRLCGALSASIEGQAFAGARGEVMLMPTSGRLGKCRVFVFGLGQAKDVGEQQLKTACDDAKSVLQRAGIQRAVIVAPKAATDEGKQSDFVRLLGASVAGASAWIDTILIGAGDSNLG